MLKYHFMRKIVSVGSPVGSWVSGNDALYARGTSVSAVMQFEASNTRKSANLEIGSLFLMVNKNGFKASQINERYIRANNKLSISELGVKTHFLTVRELVLGEIQKILDKAQLGETTSDLLDILKRLAGEGIKRDGKTDKYYVDWNAAQLPELKENSFDNFRKLSVDLSEISKLLGNVDRSGSTHLLSHRSARLSVSRSLMRLSVTVSPENIASCAGVFSGLDRQEGFVLAVRYGIQSGSIILANHTAKSVANNLYEKVRVLLESGHDNVQIPKSLAKKIEDNVLCYLNPHSNSDSNRLFQDFGTQSKSNRSVSLMQVSKNYLDELNSISEASPICTFLIPELSQTLNAIHDQIHFLNKEFSDLNPTLRNGDSELVGKLEVNSKTKDFLGLISNVVTSFIRDIFMERLSLSLTSFRKDEASAKFKLLVGEDNYTTISNLVNDDRGNKLFHFLARYSANPKSVGWESIGEQGIENFSIPNAVANHGEPSVVTENSANSSKDLGAVLGELLTVFKKFSISFKYSYPPVFATPDRDSDAGKKYDACIAALFDRKDGAQNLIETFIDEGDFEKGDAEKVKELQSYFQELVRYIEKPDIGDGNRSATNVSAASGSLISVTAISQQSNVSERRPLNRQIFLPDSSSIETKSHLSVINRALEKCNVFILRLDAVDGFSSAFSSIGQTRQQGLNQTMRRPYQEAANSAESVSPLIDQRKQQGLSRTLRRPESPHLYAQSSPRSSPKSDKSKSVYDVNTRGGVALSHDEPIYSFIATPIKSSMIMQSDFSKNLTNYSRAELLEMVTDLYDSHIYDLKNIHEADPLDTDYSDDRAKILKLVEVICEKFGEEGLPMTVPIKSQLKFLVFIVDPQQVKVSGGRYSVDQKIAEQQILELKKLIEGTKSKEDLKHNFLDDVLQKKEALLFLAISDEETYTDLLKELSDAWAKCDRNHDSLLTIIIDRLPASENQYDLGNNA